MKIYKLNTLSSFEDSNLNIAIGNFDGIHLGHQKIIKMLNNISKKNDLKSTIMSFSPHPRKFFSNAKENFDIISEEKKILLLKELGIQYYISFEFNKNLSSLSPQRFVKDILVDKLGIKNLTVGYDFRFGKDRKGDLNLLKKLSSLYSFNLSIIEPVINAETSEKYSSTSIRDAIKISDFNKVTSYLGRFWEIKGTIQKGDQKARLMNFPTANIIPGDYVYPLYGVYAVNGIINQKKYKGISNFGIRPTVNGDKILLETNLFNFDEDIYGKELTVQFLTFIRKEKKFENFDFLEEQVKKDILIAKKYHEGLKDGI